MKQVDLNAVASIRPLQPYMTLDEDIEVTYRGRQKPTDEIIVHIEEPSAIYGFKTLDINLDKMLVVSRDGFTDEEVNSYVSFCRSNKGIIEDVDKAGGVFRYTSGV